MDEHLVGYLLETLDPVTLQRVENHLRTHPEARARLDLLRQALAPLAEDAGDPDPPPDLAIATLARVAEHRCALPPAPALPPGQRATGRGWLPRADWLVAACLLVVIGGLALPAVVGQWRQAHRVACADNLRRFHAGLVAYADSHQGEFPRVEPEGPRGVAGIFVPLLSEHGVLPEVSISCPAQGKRPPLGYTADELAAIARDDPARYQAIATQLSGHYAYCLGYEHEGRLCGLRRDSGDLLPILADSTGPDAENSDNHGRTGHNVLNVGGQVRWCVQPTVGVDNDHIYVNQHNRVRAGVRRVDTVLGASAARPLVTD